MIYILNALLSPRVERYVGGTMKTWSTKFIREKSNGMYVVRIPSVEGVVTKSFYCIDEAREFRADTILDNLAVREYLLQKNQQAVLLNAVQNYYISLSIPNAEQTKASLCYLGAKGRHNNSWSLGKYAVEQAVWNCLSTHRYYNPGFFFHEAELIYIKNTVIEILNHRGARPRLDRFMRW